MGNFPSNKVMIVTLLILMGWFGFKFGRTANELFFQLAFDWNKMEALGPPNDIQLDSVSYNFLKVMSQDELSPSANSTYKVQVADEDFFFRYEYSLSKENSIVFKGLEWITDIPDSKNTEAKLTKVKIDLKQKKGTSIITIGDQIFFKNEAKYFRKRLAQLADLEFKGHERDVFNYPHEAINNSTSESLISLIDKIDTADYFVLFIGSNDTVYSSEKIKENIKSIVNKLKNEKKAKKVFILTLPPSTNIKLNGFAKIFNSNLLEISKDDAMIGIVDSYNLFQNNFQKYMREDGISISQQGYEKLAKEVAFILTHD